MAISCRMVTVGFQNKYVCMEHGFVAKNPGGHTSDSLYSDAGGA